MNLCYACNRAYATAHERDAHECPTVKAFQERPAPAPGLRIIYNAPGFYGSIPTQLAHNTGQV